MPLSVLVRHLRAEPVQRAVRPGSAEPPRQVGLEGIARGIQRAEMGPGEAAIVRLEIVRRGPAPQPVTISMMSSRRIFSAWSAPFPAAAAGRARSRDRAASPAATPLLERMANSSGGTIPLERSFAQCLYPIFNCPGKAKLTTRSAPCPGAKGTYIARESQIPPTVPPIKERDYDDRCWRQAA